jgi:hypothetical protein
MARRRPASGVGTRRTRSGRQHVKRHGTARRRGAVFTLADFVTLLRSVPKPDPEYCEFVEAITRNQPQVQPSAWES